MLEEVFLHDIWNNPDDDSVRLIYADWLMERDEPQRRDRGEFIRVQCELARWEGPFRSWREWAELAPRVHALRKRERYLLARYSKTWSQPLQGLVMKYVFRRGFVETVQMAPDIFVGRAEEVLRLAPIQHVCLSHCPDGWGALTALDCLSRLRGLSLSGGLSLPRVLPLLNSPPLARLTTLSFRRCQIPAGAMEALASWPGLARLESLAFQDCYFGNGEQLQALAHSPHLNPRCRLDLSSPQRMSALSYLSESIRDTRHPQMLRLALASLRPPGQRPNSSAIWPLLDQLASRPENAVPLLNKALHNPARAVRVAAASFVACLGKEGIACLPALIQRLDDGERGVRGSAAAALCDLIPHLPSEVQRDLCRFANPLRDPRESLQALLGREDLVPVAARRALVARCERRLAAHARRSGLSPPPLCSAFAPAAEFSARVIATMEDHAAAAGKPEAALRTKYQECAWMLARLFEILHPASAPE